MEKKNIYNYCYNCGKKNEEVDACLCNQRNFILYPKTGFPENDPRYKQFIGGMSIT